MKLQTMAEYDSEKELFLMFHNSTQYLMLGSPCFHNNYIQLMFRLLFDKHEKEAHVHLGVLCLQQ